MTEKPHVLFVDDEPRILDGLRRMLRGQRNRWDMSFANGGVAALEVLSDRHCDVVVSDFRMPDIDGAALLEKVRSMSPDTARIILSGQTSADNVMRVMTLAHQFLNKPATSDQLVDAIERVLVLQEETTSANSEVLSDISAVSSLPSPPQLLIQLLAVLDDEDASAASIGQIIESDPAIAAKILHLANSSACTAGRRLAEVTQAVALLGTNTVRGLVIMHDIVSAFTEKVNLPAAWIAAMNTHSVETARLASRFSTGKAWSSASFTAGLLHETGQLVLATSRPEQFGTILARWNEIGEAAESAAALAVLGRAPADGADVTPTRLGELETAQLATSHDVAGAKLLSLWGLPTEIVEAATRHGAAELPTVAGDLCAAVALAHAVVEAELGAVCGARPVPAIDEDGLGGAERTAIEKWRAALRNPE